MFAPWALWWARPVNAVQKTFDAPAAFDHPAHLKIDEPGAKEK